MKTLNQIKKQLTDFFESHQQVNDVKWEPEFDYSQERALTYPACGMDYFETQVSEKFFNHRISFRLGDLSSPDVEGIDDEIVSDMLLVADDLFAWLDNQEGWVLQKGFTIKRFLDDFGDRVSGITFTLTLSVVRRSNDCGIPSEE